MTRIQLKRGTSASWTSANPMLSQGEMGYETDTRRIKIGDGVNAWSTLPYSYFGVGSFVQSVGDGSATSVVVTHNLNTRNVLVSVKEASTYAEVECDVAATTVNTVTLTFATAPTANQYVATVISDGVPVISSNTSIFIDNAFTIKDDIDATKQLQFQVSGLSTSTTRTLTAPDANTTIVGTDATQALTNKDLTSGTNTFPASLVTASGSITLTNKTISGSANTLSNIPVSSLSATGTPSSSTYLRGDGSWATVSAGVSTGKAIAMAMVFG